MVKLQKCTIPLCAMFAQVKLFPLLSTVLLLTKIYQLNMRFSSFKPFKNGHEYILYVCKQDRNGITKKQEIIEKKIFFIEKHEKKSSKKQIRFSAFYNSICIVVIIF